MAKEHTFKCPACGAEVESEHASFKCSDCGCDVKEGECTCCK